MKNGELVKYTGTSRVARIPDGVVRVGRSAFDRLDSLKYVIIPASTELLGLGAFSGCSGLTTVTIPAGVKKIEGDVFAYCDHLMEFTVDEDNVAFMARSGVLYDKTGLNLVSCPGGLPELVVPEDVTNICEYAMTGCCFSSVELPSNITNIGVSGQFSHCSNLCSITIPSGVEVLGIQEFYGCGELTTVRLSRGVKVIGILCFGECRKLKEITIPSSVTEIREGCVTAMLRHRRRGVLSPIRQR